MKEWKVTGMGTRCCGHGDYVPEATVGCDGMVIDYRVSSYYGTEEQVKKAAEALCHLLNQTMKATHHG